MGQWETEATTEIYQRSRRTVAIGVWEEIKANMENPEHDYTPSTHPVSLRGDRIGLPHETTIRVTAQTNFPTAAPIGPRQPMPTTPRPQTANMAKVIDGLTPWTTTLYDHDMIQNTESITARTHWAKKDHYDDITAKTIGCKLSFHTFTHHRIMNLAQYTHQRAKIRRCKTCFETLALPRNWPMPELDREAEQGAQVDSDSDKGSDKDKSDSSSSVSDTESDTEDERVKPPTQTAPPTIPTHPPNPPEEEVEHAPMQE